MYSHLVTLSEASIRECLHVCLDHLLHYGPCCQTLHPSGIVGIVLVDDIDRIIASREGDRIGPGDEAQIGVRALVANEVLLALQGIIEHHRDTFDLVLVALNG